MARKRKVLHVGEEGKPSLFEDSMITFVENSIESTEKLPELINELIKVVRYKNQLYFYIWIMKNQKLKLKTSIYYNYIYIYMVLRSVTDKRPVHWNIENYKTFLVEMKEVLNKWRSVPCPEVGRLRIVVSSFQTTM